ncbi:condensin subunit ScpA [Anaerovirgula multivorans]|uniref:Segregation and condensation protein A n=1 Tax=Anaerovirgula multivorans TaxID=312168 RepID=A0A238ZUV5_9FIRM|nr:segregation/condensation protein A [Anaerovirgula multivorans]SNR87206.1 condensin subunit ScpA [Anaerovirgula multivorans]
MAYTIKIEAFEGPFDLLFHLIEKNEIDIYDIPINDITEQYLHYIYEMEKLDLDVTSEFLVMAATLIEIKSKMLLPKDVFVEEGIEVEDIDPRDELVRKLLEYKKYKAVTEEFKKREGLYNRIYFKAKEEIIFESHDHDKILDNLEINDLINAFNKLLKDTSKKIQDPYYNIREIEREPVSIEDKLVDILNILNHKKKITFQSIFTSIADKLEVVVTFLALLELMKVKKIKVIQEKCFDGIMIELVD